MGNVKLPPGTSVEEVLWWYIGQGVTPPKVFYVVEVRNGLVLRLEESTSLPDGWYWTLNPNSSSPRLRGPYPTVDAAADGAEHQARKRKLKRFLVVGGPTKGEAGMDLPRLAH